MSERVGPGAKKKSYTLHVRTCSALYPLSVRFEVYMEQIALKAHLKPWLFDVLPRAARPQMKMVRGRV